MDRRKFLRDTALAGIGTAISTRKLFAAPMILTPKRTPARTAAGQVAFRPVYVQKSLGPNLLNWAYATDSNWDTFHSNINADNKGVYISDTEGHEKFGVNVRWNVEGFGYTFITADNAGEFYELPPEGKTLNLNLNYELAASRVARNRLRSSLHSRDGWQASHEAAGFLALSEEYLAEAKKHLGDHEEVGGLSQKSLYYALWGSEMLELDYAKSQILKNGPKPGFFFGCDARAFYQMYQDIFVPLFTDIFNYGTITFVTKGDGIINDFEPKEGDLRFGIRDLLYDKLKQKGLKVEGRLLFWFHECCTPEWLKKKTYPELLRYVERHTREVIGHYGEGMYAWEIVNELHDWANELQLNNEQTVELTKLACEVAKDTAPNVRRLINNCCPFAEYVQMKQWSGEPAKYNQRTPVQFIRDLVDAGVDFDIIGQQMYFPERDLQDIIMMVERYEQFNKKVQLSEIGVTAGPTNRSVKLATVGLPTKPYEWHRPWDEEMQANWLEGVYTLGYSKPYIEAADWFDFVDPFSYMENGGLLRNPEGDKKASYYRLQKIEKEWGGLPKS